MSVERVSPVVRLDPRRLRVYVDVQLEDDGEVLVLVLVDGMAAVELPATHAQAAVRAARLLTGEAQLFADRVDTTVRRGSK